MNAAGLPTGIVIALLAGTVFITIVVCLIVVTRLPLERRAAFGRFLGRAFLVLLVLTMVVGMVAQGLG